MWENILWKVIFNMWYCLSLCLVMIITKLKRTRNCFLLNLNRYPSSFVRLKGICGMKTCLPICCPIAISVKITCFPKSRHTILVPLQRSFDGSKFLRSIMLSTFLDLGWSILHNSGKINACWESILRNLVYFDSL